MSTKILLIAILIVCGLKSFAQKQEVDILLGQDESDVRAYLDSLISLRPFSNYQIRKDVTVSGELVLKCEFSGTDQSLYGFIEIAAKFQRINGIEFCMSTFFYGSSEYAQNHLAYIKDEYKNIGEGKWQKNFVNNKYLVEVTFKRETHGKYSQFNIEYELEDAK